jgi:hypothetical protein
MFLLLAQEVDEKSGAYGAGKIVGYIVIVVLVVLLVRWLMNRNK